MAPILERCEDGTGYRMPTTELSHTQKPTTNSRTTTKGLVGDSCCCRRWADQCPGAPVALPEFQDPLLRPWGALTCQVLFLHALFHPHHRPCERHVPHFTDKATEA